MRCWACSRPIKGNDEVCVLPIVEAIVHRACYERELRERPKLVLTLSQYLAPSRRAA